MNLGGDLLLNEERRQRRAGVLRPVAVTPAVPALPLEPRDVVAVKRITVNRVRYEPGQSLRLGGALLRELLEKQEVWAPSEADWWNPRGRVLMAEPGVARPVAVAPTPGALRIAMGCAYDPGNAVYRYHSAINEHTKHSSLYVNFQRKPALQNPFGCPQQVSAYEDMATARAIVYGADVLHHHVDYYLGDTGLSARPRREQLLIRHYHGSMQKPANQQWPMVHRLKDDALGALLLGARLTLCALRPDRIQWLPIPVPVARYAAMREPRPQATPAFRIAHSPTKAEYKGTQVFLNVCERLNKRGVKVEPVLIGMRQTKRGKLEPDRKTHGLALRMKGTCDAVFDSFWLGIQGSGLEGAAMGLPVIAGDPEVKALYEQEIGYCPYTFANDAKRLEEVIAALATEEEWLISQSDRVAAYVREYHDYPRVAERYQAILAKALGRDDVRTAA